jgi:hypothetical protein
VQSAGNLEFRRIYPSCNGLFHRLFHSSCGNLRPSVEPNTSEKYGPASRARREAGVVFLVARLTRSSVRRSSRRGVAAAFCCGFDD